MDILNVIEIIVIALAMLIIPFIVWSVHQLKYSILESTKAMIVEHYTGLDSRISYNRNRYERLKTNLAHRTEIIVIRYNNIVDKIDEIESYLAKINGYRQRNKLQNLEHPEEDISSFH